MADYSPYLLSKSNLKYIGIIIPEGTEPDDTRLNEYGSNNIKLYDIRNFSPHQTATNKTKSRYLEYIIHLHLNSLIYWEKGKPNYLINENTLGESYTDNLLTSINSDTVPLTYEDISKYIQLFRNDKR